MMGGGTLVQVRYRKVDGTQLDLKIMAESPMIAMMAAQSGILQFLPSWAR